MHSDYIFNNPIVPHIIYQMSTEMRNFTKDQLEGVKRCIENDRKITYGELSRGFVDVIHDDVAILFYIKACVLLEQMQ